MKILIFDNYDSFTYNIVQIVKDLGFQPDIRRNDRISLDEVKQYDKIILSPGPGLPSESGILNDLIRTYAPTKSIFGICLGVQAIGEVFGARLLNLPTVFHGVSTPIHTTVSDEYTFDGIPQTFSAGRYHSWVVDKQNLPPDLQITAESDEGLIMGLRHTRYDVRGVQFHPESVLTPHGSEIIRNFLTH